MTDINKSSENGILRCCNQFPYRYKDIESMRSELPEIAELGFNAVWINPMQETGKVEKMHGGHGSLYAIADPWRFNPAFSKVAHDNKGRPIGCSREQEFEIDKTALKTYTKTAVKNGLTPMFDLVLTHAAIDSPLVTGTHPYYKGQVDTSRWFRRHANGAPDIHGLDQHGNCTGIAVWDDVVKFNYKDPKIAEEIFQNLWKPYIDLYIGELGFRGVRLDALPHTNVATVKRITDYIRELCLEKYHVEPIILGETIGDNNHHHVAEKYRGLNISHVTNCNYWTPTVNGPNNSKNHEMNCYRMWDKSDPGGWFSDNMGVLQQIVHTDRNGKIVEGTKGGTIGFASFHDGKPWSKALRDSGWSHPIAVERGMREKMAMAAFASDAGWLMMADDMFADSRPYSVFEGKNSSKPQPTCDMCPFIQEINTILKKLPATQFGSWTERRFIKEKPDLMIIVRHAGFGSEGKKTTILVNIDPQKEICLTGSDMVKLSQKTGHSLEDLKDPETHGIFCCGKIDLSMPSTPSFGDQFRRAASRTDGIQI